MVSRAGKPKVVSGFDREVAAQRRLNQAKKDKAENAKKLAKATHLAHAITQSGREVPPELLATLHNAEGRAQNDGIADAKNHLQATKKQRHLQTKVNFATGALKKPRLRR